MGELCCIEGQGEEMVARRVIVSIEKEPHMRALLNDPVEKGV